MDVDANESATQSETALESASPQELQIAGETTNPSAILIVHNAQSHPMPESWSATDQLEGLPQVLFSVDSDALSMTINDLLTSLQKSWDIDSEIKITFAGTGLEFYSEMPLAKVLPRSF